MYIELIRKNMYEAMKARDDEDKELWSLTLDALQKKQKESNKELTEEEELSVIRKEIKQYEETLQFATQLNKIEAIEDCQYAINKLSEIIPQMMTEDDIRAWINNNVSVESIKKNKGMYMKTCSQLKGKADMKLVSKIVDEILQ